MKRLWIGLGILLALLAAGLWTTEQMKQIHGGISDRLERTAQVLAQPNWEQADELLASAREEWEQNWKFTASIADHTTLDDIDGAFAEVEVYRLRREDVLCAAACARLAKQVAALEEAYSISWWNVL